jgi:hypothetical protein
MRLFGQLIIAVFLFNFSKGQSLPAGHSTMAKVDTAKIITGFYNNENNPFPKKNSTYILPGIYAFVYSGDSVIQFNVISYDIVLKDSAHKEVSRLTHTKYLDEHAKKFILNLSDRERQHLFLENILISDQRNKLIRLKRTIKFYR